MKPGTFCMVSRLRNMLSPNQPSPLAIAYASSGSRDADLASSSREDSIPPKHGRRFSSAVSGALKMWLSDYAQQPYSTARDLELLQRQTGLGRLQVRTWLANARRRAKPASSSGMPRPPTPSPVSLHTPSPAVITREPVRHSLQWKTWIPCNAERTPRRSTSRPACPRPCGPTRGKTRGDTTTTARTAPAPVWT